MGRGLCRCPLVEHQFYKHVIDPMAMTLFTTYYSLKSFLTTDPTFYDPFFLSL
jgi:hypothetical protein